MAEDVSIKISADASQASQSIGSLKKQLREAQQDVQAMADKFGATSDQAVKAAKRAAELKDRIGDAKALTDAYNPDAKFKGFAQALQGVVGGFTAVQGALGLVGVKSDEVEQTLLKVQSAMALSQGLNSVLESVDAFKNLSKQVGLTSLATKVYNFVMGQTAVQTTAVSTASKVAAISMRVLRGVMASLGIGALIFGVTALISKISSWVGSTESAKAANDRLNETIEEQNKLLDKNRMKLDQAREDAIMEAKIKGKSAGEIYKITKDFNQKAIVQEQNNYNTKKALLDEYEKKNLESYVENGKRRVRGSEEQITQYKKLQQEFEQADTDLKKAQRQDFVSDQEERLRIAEDGRNKSKKAQKTSDNQEAQRQKQLKEERLQAEKDAAKNIQDLENEIYLQSIKDDTQRALVKLSIDKENQINEINLSKATAEQKAQQLLLLDKKFQQDKDSIELEVANKRKEQEKKDAEDAANKLKNRIDLENQIRIAGITDEFQRKRAELQSQKEQEEADLAKQRADNYFSEEVYQQGLLNIKTKYAKLDADLVKENEEKKKKLREDNINLALDVTKTGLSNITNVVGRETAAGKALSVASATIDTYQAANKALNANYTVFGPAAQVARFASVAATIAVGLKNVREIVKAKVPGGGGGNTANIPSPAPITPSLPVQTTMTQLDQGTINRLGSATNRAYVVETDITNSQERIRRINRAARLN